MMYEPRSIAETTWPLLIANSLLGTGAFSYRITKPRIFLCFVYGSFCIVGYCLCAKIAIKYLDTFYLTKATNLGNITFKTLYFGNAALSLCLTIIGWLKIKDVQAIVERIEVYDQAMAKMGIQKNYRAVFMHQLCCFGLFLVSIVSFVVVNYNLMFAVDTPLDSKIVLTFTVQYPTLPMCMADYSFFFWVRYARLKFKQVNDLIRGMLTTTPQSPQHKRVLAMKYDLINKDFASLRSDRLRGSNDNVETMKAAKQIHLELVKSARRTNEAYGIQILLTMTVSFVLITGLLYDAYTIIWIDLPREDFIREMVPVCCWIGFYALKIFIVNHACARTSSEATNTGDIICELYEPSTSREFRAEIRDFTLQLIQNPLTFTACGFFNLDHTFIQGVIGSITTYLVILIQVGDVPKVNNDTTSIATSTTTALTTIA